MYIVGCVSSPLCMRHYGDARAATICSIMAEEPLNGVAPYFA